MMVGRQYGGIIFRPLLWLSQHYGWRSVFAVGTVIVIIASSLYYVSG
ncbi:MAG: hypothetical protein R2865_11630 [Deinococcales bacterium]